MKLILMAAVDKNNGIALRDKGIPWQGRVPQDIDRFHRTIQGHTVILGSTTYKEIGQLLQNQPVIVLSRSTIMTDEPNVSWVDSPDKAIAAIRPSESTCYVLGGSQTYAAFIDLADELDITMVHGYFNTDVYFPPIKPSTWELVTERHVSAEKPPFLDCTFRQYRRRHRHA